MASGHLFLPIHMHARQSVHVFSVGRGESAAARHLAQLISLENKRIGHVVIQMPDPHLPQHRPSEDGMGGFSQHSSNVYAMSNDSRYS